MSTLTRLADELLMLLHESAAYQRPPKVRAVLEEARTVVAGLRRRLLRADRRYVVAVVGLTNVGKSTLLNALLGIDVAPSRNGPCTPAPVEFAHGPELRVTAHFDILRRPSWPCAAAEAVRQRLDRLAEDGASGADHGPGKVVVQVPHPLLEGGLVLADTPGFGAAQAGGSEVHEEALKRYLRDEVSQVFWVVLAEQGIGGREMRFHDRFFADVCDDVVVTGCEGWEPAELERFRLRFAGEFGNRMPSFHFVRGRDGEEAVAAGDDEALERAGITDLADRIRDLARPSGQENAVRANLVQLADNLGTWLGEYRDGMGLPLHRRWRPDSWDRWSAALPGYDLKVQIDQALAENLP